MGNREKKKKDKTKQRKISDEKSIAHHQLTSAQTVPEQW